MMKSSMFYRDSLVTDTPVYIGPLKPSFHIIAPFAIVEDKIMQRQWRLYGNCGVHDSSDGSDCNRWNRSCSVSAIVAIGFSRRPRQYSDESVK